MPGQKCKVCLTERKTVTMMLQTVTVRKTSAANTRQQGLTKNQIRYADNKIDSLQMMHDDEKRQQRQGDSKEGNIEASDDNREEHVGRKEGGKK